jgi:phosphoribosylaminoimidazole carboxylase (NCAIR synthetase)
MRFARAAAALPGVRLVGLMQEAPRGPDAGLFSELVRLTDGLDARQILEGACYVRAKYGGIHRVVGILEPLQEQLAEVASGARHARHTIPETAQLFRDKAQMKDELRRHGLPCARHRLVTCSWKDAAGLRARSGFPLVMKPPAGMACKATWRIRTVEELRPALAAMHAERRSARCSPRSSWSAKSTATTTITIGGRPLFQSVSRYYPRPLEVIENPWIQWTCLLPRDISGPEYDAREAMGRAAIKALGLDTGMTHMEWFQRPDESLAIGEIAQRPPGANISA